MRQVIVVNETRIIVITATYLGTQNGSQFVYIFDRQVHLHDCTFVLVIATQLFFQHFKFSKFNKFEKSQK